MEPVLQALAVSLAVVVALGGVIAVGAATPRLAALGMTLALLGAAYVVDPLPGPLALGVRLVGTTLGAYLVWVALREAPQSVPGAAVAWPGAVAIAIVAFTAGFLAAGSLGTSLAIPGTGEGPGLGSTGAALAHGSVVARAALGAAATLGALAIPPVLMARDTLRLGLGLLLLLAAASLVQHGISGSGNPSLELATALFTALAGAGVAVMIATSLRRTGDVLLRDDLRRAPALHHHPVDDAHHASAPADRGGRPQFAPDAVPAPDPAAQRAARREARREARRVVPDPAPETVSEPAATGAGTDSAPARAAIVRRAVAGVVQGARSFGARTGNAVARLTGRVRAAAGARASMARMRLARRSNAATALPSPKVQAPSRRPGAAQATTGRAAPPPSGGDASTATRRSGKGGAGKGGAGAATPPIQASLFGDLADDPAAAADQGAAPRSTPPRPQAPAPSPRSSARSTQKRRRTP